MEALLEILRGERIVHIHSYRQDEILMFVRLAQEFGFTVGTFQHVLEKLDHLKSLGINAIELMPISEFPGKWNDTLE